MEDVDVDAVEWAAHCMCPLCVPCGVVQVFLALCCAPFQLSPGNGAPEGVRSSVGPPPLAFHAKADLSKLCYCAEALHCSVLPQKLLLFSMQLVLEGPGEFISVAELLLMQVG